MTIAEYIKSKVQSFGIPVSEADLLDVMLASGLDEKADDEVEADNMPAVAYGIYTFIPVLLTRPKSISEGGVSMSWDTNGLRAYYSLLCKMYGFEDILSEDDRPKVTFM